MFINKLWTLDLLKFIINSNICVTDNEISLSKQYFLLLDLAINLIQDLLLDIKKINVSL